LTDREKNIEQVLFENERLKRMIKRVSKSAMGIMRAGEKEDDAGQGIDFLPIRISAILMASRPFSDKLNEVLKTLGEYIDVSRVYIFENFDNNRKCKNSWEWVTEGVAPQIANLTDVNYDGLPYWKKILEAKGSIVVSNIRDQLPETCWEILEAQDIRSVLAFPLWVNGNFWGFMGFDECSFEREWIPFEVNILKVTSQLISNAIENQASQAGLKENIRLQELLLNISNMFITSDSFIFQLKNALKVLGEFFGVDRAYVYENSSDTSYCTYLSEWCAENVRPRKDMQPVLNYSTDIPGWHTALLEKGYINSMHEEQEGLIEDSLLFKADDLECLTVFSIRSHYHFWGFIAFDNKKSKNKWNAYERNALETIAGILAGAFERRQVNEENRRNHVNLLKINEQLKEKQGFLSQILSAAPVGIGIIKDRKITFVNDTVLRDTGYTKDELLGRDTTFLYEYDEIGEEVVRDFYASIKNNGIASLEVNLVNKNGNKVLTQLTGTLASFDSDGETFLMIAQDISEVKKVQQELIESESRIKSIVETTIDGIFICERSNYISYINKAGLELLGYTKEELGEMSLDKIFPDESEKKKYYEGFNVIDEQGTFMGDIQIVNKDNEKRYLEVSGTSVMFDNKRQYYFSLHDVTHRIMDKRALQLSEEKFRSLTENSRDHIIRLDHEGKILYCNSSFLNEYGFEEKKILKKTFLQIANFPEEFKKGLLPKVNDVLRSGVSNSLELVIHYRGRYLVFDWTITLETNVAGESKSVLMVGRDYTSRKKVEQDLLVAKDKAESADKLKSAFLANMSHEIRTPLNAIVGFANLLKEDSIDDEEKEEYINIINKSSDNLMMLINDIIDLARIESGQLNLLRGRVDVHEMLNSIFTTFKQRAKVEKGDKVSVILSVPDEKVNPVILADENRLIQIFNNLMGNALKFTSQGYVEFGYTTAGGFLRFYVRDTGVGIVHEKHSVIFDQFRQADETVSKKYGGTGLGLTICKKLVEAMGGDIGLISDPGQGAEFFFNIPFVTVEDDLLELESTVETEEEKDMVIHDVIPGNKYEWPDKMILLVDNSSSAHLQMRKYLEKTGVTVISARTGKSARELLKKRNDISIVLMDIKMPGLDSDSFVRDIKKEGVNVPIIAQAPAGDDAERAGEILNAGYDELVIKPVRRDELLEKIDRFLSHKTKM
jgi:PAS domain S-box-containing protein